MQERKDNNDFALEEDIKSINSYQKVIFCLEISTDFTDKL